MTISHADTESPSSTASDTTLHPRGESVGNAAMEEFLTTIPPIGIPDQPGRRIPPDHENRYGFTPERFGGYLWELDKAVYISFIISHRPGHGNFRRLVERILSLGLTVKIPTPILLMDGIVRRNGYRRTIERDSAGEPVFVWVMSPSEEPGMFGPKGK